jgi:hypothetical protein
MRQIECLRRKPQSIRWHHQSGWELFSEYDAPLKALAIGTGHVCGSSFGAKRGIVFPGAKHSKAARTFLNSRRKKKLTNMSRSNVLDLLLLEVTLKRPEFVTFNLFSGQPSCGRTCPSGPHFNPIPFCSIEISIVFKTIYFLRAAKARGYFACSSRSSTCLALTWPCCAALV